MTQNLPAKKPVDVLKNIINSDSIQNRLRNALDDGAGLFTLSVIDLFSSTPDLQKYDPGLIVAECMKAAALKLPISKGLGFAYVVPFKGKPTFTIGYKGMIQLALRSNQIVDLNADCIYEGETVKKNRLSGNITIEGEPTSDKPIGYFAYMKLKSGVEKAIYWTHDQVINHAKEKSPSYKSKSSAWFTDQAAMCIKTVLRQLLSKWAPMSIDFIGADTETEHEQLSDDTDTIEANFDDVTPEKETKEPEKSETAEEKAPY